MTKAYAEWVSRHRLTVVVLILALVACAGSGIRFLEFNTDFRMFFSKVNPQLTTLEKLENTYTKNDNILFVVAPKDGRVFTASALTAIETLTARAWTLPYARRVDSITNFQHVSADGDTLNVRDLVPKAATLSFTEIDRIRETSLSEPLLVKRLIAPDGSVAGVNLVLIIPEAEKGKAVPIVAAAARTLAREIETAFPRVDLHLTGSVVMDNTFAEESEHDLKTLIPLLLCTLLVLLGVLLRTFIGTAITLLVLALSVVTAMGLAGWMGIALSPSSIAAPNIIVTCALADCVHLLARFYQDRRRGLDKRAAMVECVDHSLYSMFLTGVTTAIGFASMNTSEVPVFRDLGNITALGVVAAFVLSVTLLPALLMILPSRVRRRRSDWLDRLWQRWPEWIVRHNKPLFWGMTLVILGLSAGAFKNELNDEYVKYFDESVPFRQATDFATSRLTGIYSIDYSLQSAPSLSISDPGYLEEVEAFAVWLRKQPEALHVYSITDIFKLVNKAMHEDDPQWYRLPSTPDLAAQYLLLYEMSLPYGLDLNDRISVDKRATRVTVTLKSVSSREVLGLERRASRWLRAHAPTIGRADAGGMTTMFAHIGQRNIDSMLSGTVTAEVLIALVLIVAVRSLKIGLISIVPNVVPIFMAFGLWGILVGQVGMALAVVASMTLGIIVDDTVHFLTHYLEARRERRLGPTESVVHALRAVGPASLVTGLVLMAGFSVLAFSSYEINRDMGMLTAIAIGFATVAEFLLLPPLLMMIDRVKAPATQRRLARIPVIADDH